MNHVGNRFSWCVAAGVLAAATAHGQVIITEIMYNPASFEGVMPNRNAPDDRGEPNRVEWVELYNLGDEPVVITGWYLTDEDGRTSALPDDTIIEPGEAIVLIPAELAASGFAAAWGEGFAIYPLEGWGPGGLVNLANGPSETNEMLRLADGDDQTIDAVNYDDEGDWPVDKPGGPSIYLIPTALSAEDNDAGLAWRRSEPGVHGARPNEKTDAFNGNDTGSPGFVETETE